MMPRRFPFVSPGQARDTSPEEKQREKGWKKEQKRY